MAVVLESMTWWQWCLAAPLAVIVVLVLLWLVVTTCARAFFHARYDSIHSAVERLKKRSQKK